MLLVGVLGSGFMGGLHARAYHLLPDVQVVAVTSRAPARGERLAAELGSRYVADPADVLADPAVDVVDVCLPTPEHARYAIAALRAGKHVLVEKPLAASLAEADEILEAWHGTDRILMVAHVLRFWPEYVALQASVARGDIGQPLIGFAWRLSTSPAPTRFARDPSIAGGAVLDLQIHDLDLLNWIFGRPIRVAASGIQTSRGSWDHVHTTVTYAAARASAEASSLMPGSWPFTMGLRIVGDGGAIEYSFRAAGPSVEMGRQTEPGLTLYRDGQDPLAIPVEARSAYEVEIESFVDHVRRHAQVELGSPDDAYRALALSLAARQSLVARQPIDLP